MKALMDRVFRPATEMINFEMMNAITSNEGIVKKQKEIVPGMINTWYEYVPSTYREDTPCPLVIQIHGGGQDGMRWADITIWHELAEKHNFIVVYPNSPKPGCWNCDDRDIQYLLDLIMNLKETYQIDEERIYMQGMSNGDMMTLAFTMKHPDILAAACYTSGPSSKEGIDGDTPIGELPIMQERGELDVNWMLTPETEDVYKNRYTLNDENRELWARSNGIENILPEVVIHGKDNFLIYEGSKAPVINWEIKDMGHREPVYSAQIYWDDLYAHCRLVNGKHVYDGASNPLKANDDTFIMALGSNKVYHNKEMITFASEGQGCVRIMLPEKTTHFAPLKLNEMCQSEVMCAPVEFVVACFDAAITYFEAGKKVILTLKDGRKVTLRHKSLLVEIDGRFTAMQKPCILLYGFLYVPIEEFCRLVLGMQVSFAHDVVCISNHYALLGKYTAHIICDLLGGTMRPHEKVEWE